ncbi:hypothetical protein M9H77_33802 [Catharanthus roseus]|uniref:Uncharacterized protein n=1 Tax=Catharanthus roseus TaxID=4058 RepID=A0ACB9ZJG9_CATRO|nr:hypothetical protein M9H77_33802 [Catharanthus roseus]
MTAAACHLQVSSSQKQVVGLRLYLEGQKCNRLAIHVQHLSGLPNIMTFTSADQTVPKPCPWRGSNDYDLHDQFLKPVRWRRFSNVCCSVVKHDPSCIRREGIGGFVVTGAQLISRENGPRTVLHLRLLSPIYRTAQSGRPSGPWFKDFVEFESSLGGCAIDFGWPLAGCGDAQIGRSLRSENILFVILSSLYRFWSLLIAPCGTAGRHLLS